MVYQIKRTVIARRDTEATMKTDRRTDYVEAGSAPEAALQFVRAGGYALMGELAIFPEDVVLGTCVRDRVTLVIRVESIGSDESARNKVRPSPFFRRSTDKAPTA